MPKSVLVTGANGQLGQELRVLAMQNEAYDFSFVERAELDLGNHETIAGYFEGRSFDAVINCAAYTGVDKAESEPDAANAVNHRAVEALAHIAKAKGMALVHISTDYVFDGSNYKPYTENEPTNPQGVYGQTKCDGEEAMTAINPPNSAIIRTSWVYSEFGANFVKTMLRLGRERDRLGVVWDQVGTPTYAGDLAAAILEILPRLQSEGCEVYHYSNEGVCSWYDFAKAVFEYSGVACDVDAIGTREYPTPAVRPHYSVLDKRKIKSAFGVKIPYWRDSLRLCLQRIKEQA
jgi:dTDP-4-dehydrorhamnose reductase